MLDGAADAASNVELRRNRFAGLPDLQRVIAVAGVASTARGSNCTAEQLCKFFKRREALRAANASAAGDNDVRLGEICPSASFANDAADSRP